ncbi:hypothetical protein Gotri_017060 [Gossypium trilobum]|uniref:Uncharacterized protein n=1 Tax=Gossypium trilobum TaxID=34281 RepID=A0A7J9E5E8_9ROSI|nr:hypothetical protein [Gossypium trilobum]
MEIHEEEGQGEEEQEEAASMRVSLSGKGERLRLIENVILCINSAHDIGALVEARASLPPTCCAGAPNFLFSGMPCLDSSSKTTNGLKT